MTAFTFTLLCTFSIIPVLFGLPNLHTSSRQVGAWSACTGRSGVCIDTGSFSCSSPTLSGLCPGSSSIRCCAFPAGLVSSSCTSENSGVCTRTENCPRSVLTGRCPGPGGVTCCPGAAPPVNTPPPSNAFVPQAPDVSGSLGSCTTPINSLRGECINRSACTGGTFSGLCSGSSAILCCVTETRGVTPVPASPLVSFSQFQALFTGVSSTRAEALYPYFIDSLGVASINTCLRISAFVAQIGHESAGLLFFEETVDGSQYEGRVDLGNTQPGDGRRFKGRGPIQLTGRSNYENAARSLGRSFTSRPEEVAMPSGGFEATAWFWRTRVGNTEADKGTRDGFDRTTIAINGCGGVITRCNGVEDRRSRWANAKALLGC